MSDHRFCEALKEELFKYAKEAGKLAAENRRLVEENEKLKEQARFLSLKAYQPKLKICLVCATYDHEGLPCPETKVT